MIELSPSPYLEKMLISFEGSVNVNSKQLNQIDHLNLTAAAELRFLFIECK